MKKKLIIILAAAAMSMTWKAVPASAARIPVIKNGNATSLKGTIVNVRYSGEEVSMASDSQEAPSVKIGSTIYVPCKTLFSDNGIRASYSADGSKVTLRYGARKVIFYANKKYAKVNGTKMKLKRRQRSSGAGESGGFLFRTEIFIQWKVKNRNFAGSSGHFQDGHQGEEHFAVVFHQKNRTDCQGEL